MRKLLSILLLLGFGLPFASGLVASGVMPGAGLPMCCRNNGKHHCAMAMAMATMAAAADAQAGAPAERCPWRPLLGTAPHTDVFTVSVVRFEPSARQTSASLPWANTRCARVRVPASKPRGPPSAVSL